MFAKDISTQPLEKDDLSEFLKSFELEDSLPQAITITKLLIAIFSINTKPVNAELIQLTIFFDSKHKIDKPVEEALDNLYKTIDMYTMPYDKLFEEIDVPAARTFWKVLMRFYSKPLFINLYLALIEEISKLKQE